MRNSAINNQGLLMGNAYREAGESEINGKKVSWDAGYKISILPLGNTKGQLYKYTVDPSVADKIDEQLADVGWGALLELTFKGKMVVDVDVISDPF